MDSSARAHFTTITCKRRKIISRLALFVHSSNSGFSLRAQLTFSPHTHTLSISHSIIVYAFVLCVNTHFQCVRVCARCMFARENCEKERMSETQRDRHSEREELAYVCMGIGYIGIFIAKLWKTWAIRTSRFYAAISFRFNSIAWFSSASSSFSFHFIPIFFCSSS